MSTSQANYQTQRITGWVPGAELTHPNLVDYNSNEFDNSTGVYLDIHKLPKSLEDWDYVWNHNVQELGDRLYKLSLRIGRLYNITGIQDPEQVFDPASPWAAFATGQVEQPITYVIQSPGGTGDIGDIVDGQEVSDALAQLQSIIGTRSYTGDPIDGVTWLDDPDPRHNGWWVQANTTLTHNIDEIDQLLGFTESTGFTIWEAPDNGAVYWNIKDYKNTADELVWSFTKNIELLNRSIGSREIPNRTWNFGRSDELSSVTKAGFNDTEQTVSDVLMDVNAILGNRTMKFPITQTYGLDNVYPVMNAGDILDNTTYTQMLAQLNDAIGHRVLVSNPTNTPAVTNTYILKSLSGSDITAMLNELDTEIGDRNVIDQADFFPLRDSSGLTLTSWMNTINTAFGNRTITNKGNYFVVTSDDLNTTDYFNIINDEIGNRTFTHTGAGTANYPITSDGGTLASILEELNLFMGANATIKADFNPITSLVDGPGAETYTTSGWFNNSNTASLGAIVQQIVTRIDSITGWDT